eukprot:417575_1
MITLIVSVKGFNNKRIKINKDKTGLNALKQEIVKKFKDVNEPFDILTKENDDESEWEIDEDDIVDLTNKQKLSVQFKRNTVTPYSTHGNTHQSTFQWICHKCTFINNQPVTHCEMCLTKRLLNNKNDCVSNDDYYDTDDAEQEVQVNQYDRRRKAATSSIKNLNIIACIGQIRSTFMDENNHSSETFGTGTVYKVVDGFSYIITCAHNLRRRLHYFCNNCQKTHKKSKCTICKQNKTPFNSTAKILKAIKYFFIRKNLTTGQVENEYKCDKDIVYIDDVNYGTFPFATGGYDIAIIRFQDDGYYKNKCSNIRLINTKLYHAISNKPTPEYYIYGYPDQVKINNISTTVKEMYGAESIKDEFIIKQNSHKRFFIKQTEIDASCGQSGAAIFSTHNDYIVIIGIHTGGQTFQGQTYNAGNLLDEKIDYLTNINDEMECKSVDQIIIAVDQQIAIDLS